ncbi:phage tail spike protein [Heyndrickxia oleronia]|uniref:phage tail spike protein n=1 Tax=Heyndrickxia oleronia TaxID=38875 RepID=UPI003F29EA25
MLGYIDRDRKPEKSRLFLCKPNRETIAELNEAYNKQLDTKYNGVHELSFDIPFKIEKNHKFIRNDHVDLIRGHYLIRYEKGYQKEYFIINKPKNSASGGIEVKNVQCFLLPYELNRKIVRGLKGTFQLYTPVGSEGILNQTLLTKTDWSVGYIDPDIMKKYRTFDISEKGLIELISDLSETFNAVVTWDTVNKRVNFYKNEELGQDAGLSIEYGKYLKTIDEEPDFDNVVTRLYVYGNNGISIAKFNPSGTDYIESFDYYLYPFERDENRNVIKHSNYLSDSLCHAMLDYQELLDSKQGEFTSLLEQKEAILDDLLARQSELSVLETEMDILEDRLAIANKNQQSNTQIISDMNKKQAEIDTKNSQIDGINARMKNVDDQIKSLKDLISTEKNFTKEQLIERNSFINEKVWSNTNIFKEDELYEEGIKQLFKVNQPRVAYNIDVVDFLKVVECQRDWDKLNLGDIITIRYPNFNIDVKAKLIGISHNEDNNSLSLEIANTTDLTNGFMTLKELFNKTVQSSTQIDMSKYKWDLSEENASEIGKIIHGIWDANQREIEAGVDQCVSITRKGLVVTDNTDPNKVVIVQAGIIACSMDKGKNWKHAIRADGIVAETLIGKLILSERMFIGDENGIIEIRGNLMTVKDKQQKTRVKLGEYVSGKYGLQLMSKDGKTTVLDEDGMLQTWQEGRTDNVGANSALALWVFIPSNAISIRQAMLRFKLLRFRAYSRTTAWGGGTSTTTSNGGGFYSSTEAGGGIYTSTGSGGGGIKTTGDSGVDVRYGWSQTEDARAQGDTIGHKHQYWDVLGHKHNIDLPYHSHDINVSAHSHNVYIDSHYHDVSIPSHTHDIEYGIFESYDTPSAVRVYINGYDRTVALGGTWNYDVNNLNITSYLNIGQWNSIEIGSSSLGRIDASIFVQAFMGV